MSKRITIEDLARITVKGFSEVKTEIIEIKETLKDHSKKFEKIDQRFERIDEHFDDIDQNLDEINQRMEKVELNTRVYPYDKEHVDKKFSDHELRIGKLEAKQV